MAYPRQKQPLTDVLKEMLKGKTEIIDAARAAGFEKLIINAVRHPGSTSAKPGKVIEMTIDLKQ
jgi:hypothetical protein